MTTIRQVFMTDYACFSFIHLAKNIISQ